MATPWLLESGPLLRMLDSDLAGRVGFGLPLQWDARPMICLIRLISLITCLEDATPAFTRLQKKDRDRSMPVRSARSALVRNAESLRPTPRSAGVAAREEPLDV